MGQAHLPFHPVAALAAQHAGNPDHRLDGVEQMLHHRLAAAGADDVQHRQRAADRDKVMSRANAQHREDLHQAREERQRVAAEQIALLLHVPHQNTELTETAKDMAARIGILTVELHNHIPDSNHG